MNSPAPATHRTPRGLRARLGSTRARAALALGIGLTVAATGTFAAWTDTATIAAVGISTGSVNLEVDEGTGAANWRENIADSTVLDITGLMPGQSTAGIIKVRNTGSGALNTTLVASATSAGGSGGSLHSSLVVKVTADTAVTGSGNARTCAGGAVAGSGTTLNSTLLPSWSLAGGNTSRTVCVQVTLDTNAPSTLQNATTTATLTFNGTTA